MRHPGRAILFVLAAEIALHGATGSEERPSPWVWDDVPRIVAIGDVHGSYDEMLQLLRGTGLIDAKLQWSGGEDHLVLCGDLVDRGPDDRKVLDFVRALLPQAEAAGGQVHVLLGNHEVMNMSHDLRYVAPEGFAAFAQDETEDERQAGWSRYRSESHSDVSQLQLRSAFEETHPPGYYARAAAFEADGEYGAWLLELPAVIKINGVVFMHGGLTDTIAALGLDEINREVKESILRHLDRKTKLRGAVRGAAHSDEAIAAAAVEIALAEEGVHPEEMVQAALELEEQMDELPFTPEGPLWYRGNSLEDERIERAGIDDVLAVLEAKALVVGHTPTETGFITSRFENRVFRVDVGLAYGGQPMALVFKSDEVRVFDAARHAFKPPLMEHPQGEGWHSFHEQLPDRQLEQFLKKAKIKDSKDFVVEDKTIQIVELESKGLRLRAVFQHEEEEPGKGQRPGSKALRRYQHELAAYRLDRLMGLRMVPVTALRSIDGKDGSLQILVEGAVDLKEIETYGRWDVVAGLESDINRARVFTALLDIRERAEAGKLFLPKEHRIMIADNIDAFSNSREPRFPEIDEDAKEHVTIPIPCGPVGPVMERALISLQIDDLEKRLGKLLTKPQIESVLSRRDRLLEICSGGE